jgi:cytochrome c-type biogenesis protein CcmH/NrfF
MNKPTRLLWLMPLAAVLFCSAALVTLRAAEQANQQQSVAPAPKHPAPSKPEESATIADDPTIAPDSSQSADNDVSFPSDI